METSYKFRDGRVLVTQYNDSIQMEEWRDDSYELKSGERWVTSTEEADQTHHFVINEKGEIIKGFGGKFKNIKDIGKKDLGELKKQFKSLCDTFYLAKHRYYAKAQKLGYNSKEVKEQLAIMNDANEQIGKIKQLIKDNGGGVVTKIETQKHPEKFTGEQSPSKANNNAKKVTIKQKPPTIPETTKTKEIKPKNLSKTTLQKKLAKLQEIQKQRAEISQEYYKLSQDQSQILQKMKKLQGSPAKWMKPIEKDYRDCTKELGKARNKLSVFDKKHPTLAKDIKECEDKIKQIEQQEYDKKHPKLTSDYLKKVGETKFTKEAVARANEIVENTVKETLNKITRQYQQHGDGWFLDAYDKDKILKASKEQLEKHNTEMGKLLGDKYQKKVKAVIDNLNKGIADNDKLIESFDSAMYEIKDRIRDSYWDTHDYDGEDGNYEIDERIQEATYEASKWIALSKSEISAMQEGKWETVPPLSDFQQTYMLSHY